AYEHPSRIAAQPSHPGRRREHRGRRTAPPLVMACEDGVAAGLASYWESSVRVRRRVHRVFMRCRRSVSLRTDRQLIAASTIGSAPMHLAVARLMWQSTLHTPRHAAATIRARGLP